ncbi:hypothetical protein [Paenibacillus sp. 1_12]|uniref:glucosamine inositolphosphorylceramide transferase family protein n=1 Tax=Paenibacillus sp. 1_12 TaxID=1566278 RepID=UPI00116052E6|nr:hypothetical protein [Paenibacillus sp. 1_12]
MFIKPSLQASDVTDIQAELVADPFLVIHDSITYLFFEVYNKVSEKGEIGFATSIDLENWSYGQIVLDEKFHLSYPQVFKYRDEFYMIPESIGAGKVLLYRAANFPYGWEVTQELIQGKYVDPSVFQYEDKWWMYAGTKGQLHLFYANDLRGNWKEHKCSPINTHSIHVTRPGGRVVVDNNVIYRYMQEGTLNYGQSVHLFQITKLTEDEFEEIQMDTVLKGTDKKNDWRKDGMHHIDQLKLNNNQWLVAVDGHTSKRIHYILWKMDRLLSKIQYKIYKNKNSGRLHNYNFGDKK